MKLKSLLNIRAALAPYHNAAVSAGLAYKFFKIKKAAEAELPYYSERAKEIVNKYAVKDKNGAAKIKENGEPLVRSEDMAEFSKAVAELNAVEVNAPPVTLSISELAEIKLSADTVEVLSELITEE